MWRRNKCISRGLMRKGGKQIEEVLYGCHKRRFDSENSGGSES